MARIHQPLQKQSNGRWDYTVSSDEEGWAHATGYCTGWRDPDETDAYFAKQGMGEVKVRPEVREKLHRFREKFHSDGHATAAEAEACYREYELDFELRFSEDKDVLKRCGVCEEFTTGRASLGQFGHYAACPKHQTREDVQEIRTREDARLKRYQI